MNSYDSGDLIVIWILYGPISPEASAKASSRFAFAAASSVNHKSSGSASPIAIVRWISLVLKPSAIGRTTLGRTATS